MEIIKNPVYVRSGDLMIVPSEEGRAQKKLHVGVDSLRKRGLSVGDTCRAENYASQVKAMLSEDTGKTRVFFVSATRDRWCGHGSASRNYLDMAANTAAGGVQVDRALLCELPQEGMERKLLDDCCVKWCRSDVGSRDVVAALTGRLHCRDVMLVHGGERYGCRDLAAKTVYEEDHVVRWPRVRGEGVWKIPGIPKYSYSLQSFVPSWNEYDCDEGAALSADNVESEFLGTLPWESDSNRRIWAPAKFLEAYAANGAVFVRDPLAAKATTALVASRLMECFAARHATIVAMLDRFERNLRLDRADERGRVRRMASLARRLARPSDGRKLAAAVEKALAKAGQ